MNADPVVLLEKSDKVAVLAINRPEAMNALSLTVLDAIGAALDSIRADEDLRVLIVTGVGVKAFVAGADIRELAALDGDGARNYSDRGLSLFDRIESFEIPVIAAVNGFCLGGGCELALACHLRIASRNARFGQPEVKLGLVPGFGGTQRLPRLVGRGRALEMLLSGEMISAETALSWGLVNRVVDEGRLMEECRELASRIGANAPGAVRDCLTLVDRGLQVTQSEALKMENSVFADRFSSAEMREGTAAFLEKRKPEFKRK